MHVGGHLKTRHEWALFEVPADTAESWIGNVRNLKMFEDEGNKVASLDIQLAENDLRKVRVHYHSNGSHKRIIATLLMAFSMDRRVDVSFRGSGGYYIITEVTIK